MEKTDQISAEETDRWKHREEGLAGQTSKGQYTNDGRGSSLCLAIIIPTLLLADLTSVYVQVMLISTVWMERHWFIDDYLKLRGKRLAQQKGERV